MFLIKKERMSHVFSLSDLKGRDEDSDERMDDRDKRDRQTYYAGGTKSGVAIVGPNKDQKATDELFNGSRSGQATKIAPKAGETVMHVLVEVYPDYLTYKLDDAEPVKMEGGQEETLEFVEALSHDKLPQVLRAVRAKDGSVPLFDFEVIDKRKETSAPPPEKKPTTFTGLLLEILQMMPS